MSHQDKVSYISDFILTVIGVGSGVASTLDNVEQLSRIFLVWVSIFSGVFLILVNWQKATAQVKKWLNR